MSGRRAVVLGAGGFLGSHLCRRLVHDGWQVTALVRDPVAAHVRARLDEPIGDVTLVAGDAFDPDFLEGIIGDAHAVFPFAAHSGAARSMQEPFDNVAANAVGQLAVLEAVRRVNPTARLVFPGSRLQYGRAAVIPVPETHPQVPTSLYGLHKATGEGYHRLYRDLYGIETCVLRISNPYGPHQDRPDRAFGVVGTFLATAARNETITLYGGGTQRREYVYVDDLIDLCVTAATHPAAPGQAFNAGGSRPTSIREMAETVVSVVGSGQLVDAPWPTLEGAVETGDYVGDLTKVADILGWTPTTTLADGLTRTWAALEPSLGAASRSL